MTLLLSTINCDFFCDFIAIYDIYTAPNKVQTNFTVTLISYMSSVIITAQQSIINILMYNNLSLAPVSDLLLKIDSTWQY